MNEFIVTKDQIDKIAQVLAQAPTMFGMPVLATLQDVMKRPLPEKTEGTSSEQAQQ